jgi:tRNA-2-methylthio-N6-dimethylallyladenosine synthase
MEKIIDENKQGQSLVLDQHKNNTKKLYIESSFC